MYVDVAVLSIKTQHCCYSNACMESQNKHVFCRATAHVPNKVKLWRERADKDFIPIVVKIKKNF